MAATTLTRCLLRLGRDSEEPGFAQILSAVAVAMKVLASTVSRGPLAEGDSSSNDFSRRDYRRLLRRHTTEVVLEQVEGLEELAAVSVAGRPHINQISQGGRFLLLVDAIHGLGNLDDNLPVGTTFSILPVDPKDAPITEADFCQPGSDQVCAGIALFGPRTLLVLTTGDGVHGFTLDREVGNFVLTRRDMRIPAGVPAITINPSEAHAWPAPVRRYVDECLLGLEGPRANKYTMRWNASAVVGLFRMLSSGGVFFVPDTSHAGTWLAPYLYIAGPMGLLTEQAGGKAVSGVRRLLDEVPAGLDSQVPMYLGERDEVERLIRYKHEHDQGQGDEQCYPLFHHRSLFID